MKRLVNSQGRFYGRVQDAVHVFTSRGLDLGGRTLARGLVPSGFERHTVLNRMLLSVRRC